MNNSQSKPMEIAAPSFEHIVEAYNLSILTGPGDWSLEGGDLALTKDGDPITGDLAYNGLFRFVQTWRYNTAHLHYLFDTMTEMIAWRTSLDEKANAIGKTSSEKFLDFAEPLGVILEEQRVATFGATTYSGCLILVLSGALLRLKDDLDAEDEWNTTGPFFNSHSVGAIVVAAANGFRHADEWAKTHPPNKRQRLSQDVLNGALAARPISDETSPGRCVEVLQLLSSGGFEGLASDVFAYAHNLALKIRGRAA
jgi:hypothetical protein